MTNPNQTATDRVDVLIIGAGPSGSVVANEMSQHGFSVVCLEQGRWFNNGEFPGDKPEWELLSQQRWSHDPNIRGTADDYPLAVGDSDLHPVMIGGVGGSSLFYGGHWMRLLPSDFRMHTLDGVGDDWPLTHDDLAPYYDKLDRAVGVSGVEGDPMYPAGLEPPLPPHPIGKIGRRAAEGMNKLGWHWWPSPNAIASQKLGELARCLPLAFALGFESGQLRFTNFVMAEIERRFFVVAFNWKDLFKDGLKSRVLSF